MTQLNLDPERLSSLDEFGDRKYIIPAEVKGHWHNLRERLGFILLLIFLVLPWTKINGMQSLFLDFDKRQFTILGLRFWAHDGPLVFFIFAILTLSLIFVTSIWGRVWCGWACPQTVFIDQVYRKIERWVEGNYLARRKLAQDDISFEKIYKKSLKWFLFFFVSSIIAHSFAAYFVGSDQLLKMIQGSPTENWTYFLVISSVTGLVLFDFAWFREQFCIIMCPYGKFQSVLMDQGSRAVLYDQNRGEPRKGSPLALEGKKGDCVSCNRCVQVCPTGIDIRKGLQMECIACTACMDACDEIMTKVKKPTQLIRYASVSGAYNKITNPRSLIYLLLIIGAFSGLAWAVAQRKILDISVLRGTESPYQTIKNENAETQILNHFKAHFVNQSFENIELSLSLADLPQAELKTPEPKIILQPNESKTIHFFILFPESLTAKLGRYPAKILIHSNSKEPVIKETELVGPKKSTVDEKNPTEKQ